MTFRTVSEILGHGISQPAVARTSRHSPFQSLRLAISQPLRSFCLNRYSSGGMTYASRLFPWKLGQSNYVDHGPFFNAMQRWCLQIVPFQDIFDISPALRRVINQSRLRNLTPPFVPFRSRHPALFAYPSYRDHRSAQKSSDYQIVFISSMSRFTVYPNASDRWKD